MDGAIEGIVFSENEENNEGHVDVMRVSFLYVVKDLQDGQHLRGRGGRRLEHTVCVGDFHQILVNHLDVGLGFNQQHF